jgi:parvulin-like peptidyl-prolyl isomerase
MTAEEKKEYLRQMRIKLYDSKLTEEELKKRNEKREERRRILEMTVEERDRYYAEKKRAKNRESPVGGAYGDRYWKRFRHKDRFPFLLQYLKER